MVVMDPHQSHYHQTSGTDVWHHLFGAHRPTPPPILPKKQQHPTLELMGP